MTSDDILQRILIGAGKEINCDSNEYKKAKYSVEILIENLVRFLITGVIAMILNVWWYFLFFAMVYGIIKTHAYGIHMENPIMCTVSGVIVYYGSIYLSFIHLNNMKYFSLLFLGILIHILYAPAVSKMQWVRESRKKSLKKRVVCILIILCILQFFLPIVFKQLILYAILASSINVLPISFIIFEGRRKLNE